MARTDKDRDRHGLYNRNYAKANRALKREGNKRFRRSFRINKYSKYAFLEFKTKRAYWYYY